MNEPLLLDTCAVIWVGNSIRMREAGMQALAAADQALSSPVSAWEIGMLSRTRTRPNGLTFLPDVRTWMARLLARRSIRVEPVTVEIALDAATLPGTLNGDPADRLLVATARRVGASILTRDRKILAYAAEGWVKAVAC